MIMNSIKVLIIIVAMLSVGISSAHARQDSALQWANTALMSALQNSDASKTTDTLDPQKQEASSQTANVVQTLLANPAPTRGTNRVACNGLMSGISLWARDSSGHLPPLPKGCADIKAMMKACAVPDINKDIAPYYATLAKCSDIRKQLASK